MESDRTEIVPFWLKYLVATLIVGFSLLWVVQERVPESLISLVASAGALVGLIFAGGEKAKAFSTGVAFGVVLVGLLPATLAKETQNSTVIDCKQSPEYAKAEQEIQACQEKLKEIQASAPKITLAAGDAPKNTVGPKAEELQAVQRSNDFSFELESCAKEGSEVVCALLVRNYAADRLLYVNFGGTSANIQGEQFRVIHLKLGGEETGSAWVYTTIPGEGKVPYKLKIRFGAVPSTAKGFDFLRIGYSSDQKYGHVDFSPVEFK